MLSLDPDVEVVGECANGADAVQMMKEKTPNLLFLDIQMPGFDGFEVLDSIQRDRLPVVVFVTAFNEYALRAFEARAFDYLLKPFDRKRFSDVLKRAKSQVSLVRSGDINTRLLSLFENLDHRKSDHSRVAIRSGGHVLLVKTQSIDWVETADNYVCLHGGSETRVVRETMTIFSIINAILLNPAGIEGPDRVVAVRCKYEKLNLMSIGLSATDFDDTRNAKDLFSFAAFMNINDFSYTKDGVPERLAGAIVYHQWFDVFGGKPALGPRVSGRGGSTQPEPRRCLVGPAMEAGLRWRSVDRR